MRRWLLPLILLAEIALFTILSGQTFTSASDAGAYFQSYFADLLCQSAPVLLLAFGMTIVLMTAGIDLSVGSLVALVACVMSSFPAGTEFWWTAVPLSLALALLLGATNGALIAEVAGKSPAEKAGLKSGDVVTEVAGKKVEDPRELQLLIANLAPGSKADLKIMRDGKDQTFTVELAERPTGGGVAAAESAKAEDPDVLDGVTVADIDVEARKRFDLPESVKGVVITEIAADSPSAEAGIKVGDVIHEANREPVTSSKQAVELSEKLKKEKKVLLRVSTKGQSRFVVVERKE